ncbi:rhamnan synthesis F family protein [Polynucleobacter sp. IMCC 30228]|uniref:rhamnan synthesis F family protein n=1 Tax=Polynucleobacter sp. IMCC 30228 TaxID=2781011 RepID=UPI001F3C33F6|nr:rhamnan synthesis F family protein [Polynucleobacter sp. IMCC 30228]MCE7527876.1 rhamnan synthesis F family protein [Polynucleobacter sp. IMCC 30228]
MRTLINTARESLRHGLLTWMLNVTPPRQFVIRNTLFNLLPSLFKGTSQFNQWQEAKRVLLDGRPSSIHFIDLQKASFLPVSAEKKIAIHAHLFYADLANELGGLIQSLPIPIDLFISTPHEQDLELIEALFRPLPTVKQLTVALTPNRGRDLAPLICTFGPQLAGYDYFAHIHTKKSLAANSFGDTWRDYLWQQLLGSKDHRIEKILTLLSSNALIYPQKFAPIDVINCQWGPNWETANRLCEKWGIAAPVKGFIEFPVGTMFWAQSQALAPLLLSGLQYADFDEELGQTDGTLAHALERCITHLVTSRGLDVAILITPTFFNPYP